MPPFFDFALLLLFALSSDIFPGSEAGESDRTTSDGALDDELDPEIRHP